MKRLDELLRGKVGHNPIELLHDVRQERLQLVSADVEFVRELVKVFARFQTHLNFKSWFAQGNHAAEKLLVTYFSAEFD